MDTGLKDKVILITGGGGDIGKATALAFAAEGAKVVIADVNVQQAQAVIDACGGTERGLAVKVDVTNPQSVQAMYDEAVKRFGAVDILVNGAGIFHSTPIDDLTAEAWDQLMAINLKGVFLCAQGALRVMKPKRSGTIINIASMGGQVGGIVAGADYSSSKAGVACFTKSLAKNAGPFNINVNTVNPGVILTQMTRPWGDETLKAREEQSPLGRLGTAEDVAWAIVFLASDKAKFIHGTHLDINGGVHMD